MSAVLQPTHHIYSSLAHPRRARLVHLDGVSCILTGFTDLTVCTLQDTAAAQTAGMGSGLLVASNTTNCSAGFAGSLYNPPSTNDVRAWAAAWMWRMTPTRTSYLTDASTFLSAWYLETQVPLLAALYRIFWQAAVHSA